MTACAFMILGGAQIAVGDTGPGRTPASVLPPVLVDPANGAVISAALPDTLSWVPSPGATSYRMQVTTDSTFSLKDSLVIDSTIAKTTFIVSGLKPKIYYWRVMAEAGSTDTSAWSSGWSFTNGPPPPPVQISPPAQSSNRPSPITLRWTGTFAQSFHVRLAQYEGDFTFAPSDIVVDTTLTADSLVVGGLKLGQPYYWRVMSINRNGDGPWSSIGNFVTSYPPSVSILQPGNGDQVDSAGVSCSWLQTGGAIHYELQVSKDPYYITTPIVDTTVQTTSVKLPVLSDGLTYYWRVRAQSNVGGYWGAWTTSVFYTKIAMSLLKTPVNGGEDHAVNALFRWKDLVGAAFYQVQIASDTSYRSLVYDSTTTIAIDSLTVDSLAPNSTFYWRVRGGSNSNGWGPYSAAWKFSTSSRPPAPPLLLSPSNGGAVLPVDAVLSWHGASGATEYHFEISSDSTFRTIELNDSTIVSDSVTVDSLAIGTKYYWKVKAGSAAAGWGAFSPFRVFSTTPYLLPPPVLTVPSDSGKNIPTNVVLHWNAVPHAKIYQVQLSTRPKLDTLIVNDTADVVDSLSVKSLMRSFKYYWRVRAGLSHNSWGPYSSVGTFTAVPWNEPSGVTVSDTVDFPDYPDISEFKTADYKLFGLPGENNLTIGGLLEGTPGKDWQAYLDNGDTANYLVKYDGSNKFDLSLGRAFWLIHNGPLGFRTTVNASPLDSLGQTLIPLHPGWNIITDPFIVNVPWDSVQAINRIGPAPIWAFNKNFNVSQTLSAFNGYYFFNADSLKELVIPYIEQRSTQARPKKVMEVSSVNSGWMIHVQLVDDGVTDSSTWFGVSGSAASGFNGLDVRKPAPPGFEPSAYFNHTGRGGSYGMFASEIHPVFADSSSWTLDVDAVPGKTAALTFSGLEGLPASYAAFLHYSGNGSWVNIGRLQRYSFVPASRTTRITILIGRSSIVNSAANSPGAFRLGVNYPNPFNPTTVISYELPKETLVTLNVYDVLGQKVATLVNGQRPAGEHTVEFNGSRFASGVYFYRLVAGNHVMTRKMVLLK